MDRPVHHHDLPPELTLRECNTRGGPWLQHIRLFFAYNGAVPNVRSCLVSFTDTEGIEHSIRVPAESLYEAAIEAMAAFRRGDFAEMNFAAGKPWRVSVREPGEEN